MAAKAKPLTLSEAHRAIYIDFEGFKGKSPTFFGWVWAIGKKASDDHLACIHDIHDKALWPQRFVRRSSRSANSAGSTKRFGTPDSTQGTSTAR